MECRLKFEYLSNKNVISWSFTQVQELIIPNCLKYVNTNFKNYEYEIIIDILVWYSGFFLSFLAVILKFSYISYIKNKTMKDLTKFYRILIILFIYLKKTEPIVLWTIFKHFQYVFWNSFDSTNNFNFEMYK